MKVLIAYDGSDCANAALADLRWAGLPGNVEAAVISVVESWLLLPTSEAYRAPTGTAAQQIAGAEEAHSTSALEAAYAQAQRACERLQHLFPAWQLSAEAAAGSPASTILTRADEWQPDLLVVGSHGHTALGRFFLGSVSQKVVTEAHCSVRVGRGQVERDETPVRIIIGADGSPGAEAAVQAVASRVWPPGSEARIVIAVDSLKQTTIPHAELLVRVHELQQQMTERVRKMTVETAEQLRAAGLSVSSAVREGDPKHILTDDAEAWKADCIFVGARGLSRLERFWLGSVSAAIVARAHCSVEVVRDRQRQ